MPKEPVEPPRFEPEQWVDEGSIRAEAAAATHRATAAPSASEARARDRSRRVDPILVAEIEAAVGPERSARLVDRLGQAQQVLERDRLDDARRLTAQLVRELPGVRAVQELDGLVRYRLGHWKPAARSLELAKVRERSPELLPVLADCYRALKRWDEVDRIWAELRRQSPAHEVMAEGRIVVAGALADQGRVPEAIELLRSTARPPKRVREHHLRQWYALADLYDRAGDTISAATWFRTIAAEDPEFVDVTDRLRSLGR